MDFPRPSTLLSRGISEMLTAASRDSPRAQGCLVVPHAFDQGLSGSLACPEACKNITLIAEVRLMLFFSLNYLCRFYFLL